MRAMNLPRPDKRYGHYYLPDGSRIYQSGNEEQPVQPGMWFVWFCSEMDSTGNDKKEGRVIMLTKPAPPFIMYFSSPQEALDAINKLRRESQ